MYIDRYEYSSDLLLLPHYSNFIFNNIDAGNKPEC